MAGTLSDGVLIMNANLPMDELKKTEQRGAPVVLCMWEKPDAPPELPCIAVDFYAAGATAAQHLLDSAIATSVRWWAARRAASMPNAIAASSRLVPPLASSTACRVRATSVIRLKRLPGDHDAAARRTDTDGHLRQQ
jgi:hypothetical protein